MGIKPILFNTDMVRAILDGKKTVTRRIVKPQPSYVLTQEEVKAWALSGADPYGMRVAPTYNELLTTVPYKPGDILYVRETWAPWSRTYGTMPTIHYRADSENLPGVIWKPSINMPKEIARLWLKVTRVRMERLQDMTVDDVLHEGTSILKGFEDFKKLWDSTLKGVDISKYGWDTNPYVWVIELERCEKQKEETV